MSTVNPEPTPTQSHLISSSLLVLLARLIDYLDRGQLNDSGVISWSCPVICFGDPTISTVATLGLNPSNREFVDECGHELKGIARRFHTLSSLGLSEWSEVDARDLELIIESCCSYFSSNPYDSWFRKLDQVIAGANASFYASLPEACHLDLVPYATKDKWTALKKQQRHTLLRITGDSLELILRDTPITTLILNGRSVVKYFELLFGCTLTKQEAPGWTLRRQSHRDVTGFAYQGFLTSVGTTALNREILVLGFNHNLQSSFGISTGVLDAIKNWITLTLEETRW